MVGTYDFSLPPYKLFLELGESLNSHIPEGVRVARAQSWCWGNLSNISGVKIGSERARDSVDSVREGLQLLEFRMVQLVRINAWSVPLRSDRRKLAYSLAVAFLGALREHRSVLVGRAPSSTLLSRYQRP